MKSIVSGVSQAAAVHPSEGIWIHRGPLLRPNVFTSQPRSSASGISLFSVSDDGQSVGSSTDIDDHIPINGGGSSRRTLSFVGRRPANGPTASGSSTTADDEDDDAAAQRLWYKLDGHRKRIRELRREKAGLRKALRASRKKLAEVDNTFMSLASGAVFHGEVPANSPQGTSIFSQFKLLRDMRTKHGTTESRLEELEDELEREEIVAELTEVSFFRHIYRESPPEGDEDDKLALEPDDDRPPSRTSLLGIPGDRPVDIHPLYKRLLHAIGEKGLASEDYEDLVAQRDMILETLETRRKIDRRRDLEDSGPESTVVTEQELDALKTDLADPAKIDSFLETYNVQIDGEDLDFLRSYPETEKETLARLKSTTLEIARLRALCIEHGVMLKHPTLAQEYIILNALGERTDQLLHMDLDIITEPTDNRQPGAAPAGSLGHPVFNVLLSDPQHVLDQKTAEAALKESIKQRNEHQSQGVNTDADRRQVNRYIKEASIEGLLINVKEEDKGDYINRWLMQRLRTTPLEVQLLLNTFSATVKLKVNDFVRWQQDVLRFWYRDAAANRNPKIYDGPVTSRDSLDIFLGDRDEPSRRNSAADLHASVASDGPAHVDAGDQDWVRINRSVT